MAGLAACGGLDTPFDERLTGWRLEQADWPHWLAGVLQWLALYREIQAAPGRMARAYREALKREMAWRGPAALYAVVQSLRSALEAEAAR